MQSLEQIRARNALNFANAGKISGDKGGEVMKKIPPLIINNGLLATAAFSFSEKEGWQAVFDAIAKHLADKDVGILILPSGTTADRKFMMDCLTKGDSALLKRATAETMAWLNYARRFVNKGDKGDPTYAKR